MRFLVDAQLPPVLARWLVERGYEAEHVADIGLQAASDRQILDFAEKSSAIIVSKDEDFAQRRAILTTGPSIVWVRLPNARSRDLLQWFDKALPNIIKALEAGEFIVEVR